MTSSQATTTQRQADLAAVVEALRAHDRFLVTTHENPDGDALGSLLATTLALRQLGKDAYMYLAGGAPLPGEYSFMPLEELSRAVPGDAGERVLVAVDCANESRLGPDPEILQAAPFTIDIDHHHDNTRFGDVNLIVADASSTAEVLRDIFLELDVSLTPNIAEALYIALVTDTGRFQYTNTTPKALRLAAELVEAGADIHRVFQGVYENVQFAKLKLLARALDRAAVYEGGAVVISFLLRDDFSEVGAAEPYSEGIIDSLRAVEGAILSVLIREPPRADGPTHRISLRSSSDELDVSAIARKRGGGGHRQAAGFSTEETVEEITEFLRSEYRLAQQAGDTSRPAEPASGAA
ncbi:MAG: DHH family phosphoesterase [Gaiellaceae bacterium]